MLPSCDLTQLSDTLFEFHEIHDKGNEGYRDVALRSPIDKMWHWVNGVLDIKTEPLEDRARETLVKTKQQFLRCLDEQNSIETTLHLPRDIRAVKGLTESECALLRVGTHCLFLTTHKMLLNPAASVEGLQKLWQNLWKEKIQAPFLDDAYLQKLERFTRRYAMVALAAMLEVCYPIDCFSKILQTQKLDASEVKMLRKWTKEVEKKKSHISVYLLHAALTGVVEGMLPTLSLKNTSVTKNVAIIEWRLYFGMCDLLGEDDHLYLDWAKNTVYPGASLPLIDKQILVGNPVALLLPKAMHARLYELPEDPTSLLFVGCNPAVLGIWHVNAERCAQWCLPVQVKDTDRLMRYFVIEHLSLALVDMHWKTAACQLDQADRLYLEQLVLFLAWLVSSTNTTPRNLRVDYLYFHQRDGNVRLRALMPFDLPGPHNFVAIEQFVYECAKGNRWVFRYLMQASGLNQHPLPVYIRTVALEALLGKHQGATVQDKLNRKGITDPVYIDQIYAMVKALEELRDKCLSTLLLRLKSPTLEPELKECLAEALVAHQIDWGFSSSIEPSLLEPEGLQAQGLQAFTQAFIQSNPALF